MSHGTCTGEWVRALRRITDLRPGDRVFTPARRWETVVTLHHSDGYTRSTRVVTDATGPDFPWDWTNRHLVATLRRRQVLTTVPVRAAA